MLFYDSGSHLGRFCPWGDIWQCQEIVLFVTAVGGYTPGISWAESEMLNISWCTPRTALTTKNDPAQNVSSAEAEKLICGSNHSVGASFLMTMGK